MSERLSLRQVEGAPPDLKSSELTELAGLYARVFAGPPWNEYTACPVDGTFFSKTTQPGQSCPDDTCDAKLEPAYPLETTKGYISRELERPDAALWLLRDEDEGTIAGFSWGFAYDSPEAFAQDKYKTTAMQLTTSALLRRLGLGRNGLWYLSESGIEDDPRYRGRGLSREFHTRRLEVAQQLGVEALQRTSASGPMYRTSRRSMEQIMGPEAVVDANTGRLVVTGKLVNDLADRENPERVLFVRHKSPPNGS